MSSSADSMPDFTGCIIDKRYELVRLLGSGTFGVVYKALDMHSSPDAEPTYRAIKIIRKAGREREELATIRREVALHSVVAHHPNIVGIHDAYDDDEYFYIILDYHSGGDLFEQVCEKELYMHDDELLRGAFLSLIDAVQACHDAGIAHRDLKPENVLTTEDGSKVFLADFGLATTKAKCADYGAGTPVYMAPECYGPHSYSPRSSDVWALGVILFNMITCNNPWSKATLKDRSFARFISDADYLYESIDISEGAHHILLRIFTFNPSRRITLPKLRQMVVSLDTFFRTTEFAGLQCKTAETIGSPLHYSSPDTPPGLSPSSSSCTSSNDEDTSSDAIRTPAASVAWKATSSKDLEELDCSSPTAY